MLTLPSPYTVIKLVELPIGGKLMNVALSVIIALRSSALSVNIQSTLRGKIATSRDMTALLCKFTRQLTTVYPEITTCLIHRELNHHIFCTLYSEKLSSDPDGVVTRTRRTGAIRYGAIAVLRPNKSLQRGGEVNIRASLLLNRLYDSTASPRYDSVKFVINFTDICS